MWVLQVQAEAVVFESLAQQILHFLARSPFRAAVTMGAETPALLALIQIKNFHDA
jgi:hypothetical protein